jgi:hypothetical protein
MSAYQISLIAKAVKKIQFGNMDKNDKLQKQVNLNLKPKYALSGYIDFNENSD